MSAKPMRHMQLRQQIIKHKDFLRKCSKTTQISTLRSLIAAASPEEVRVLQNIIVAHVDKMQSIPISSTSYKKLLLARKMKFIQKFFAPSKTLGAIEDARKLILKIVAVLRLFVKNIIS